MQKTLNQRSREILIVFICTYIYLLQYIFKNEFLDNSCAVKRDFSHFIKKTKVFSVVTADFVLKSNELNLNVGTYFMPEWPSDFLTE